MDAFHLFVWAHIVTGSVGLLSFWLPVLTKKGGRLHRRGGVVFTRALLATGCFAVGMSVCTLIDPLGTHPQLTETTIPSVHDLPLVRGLFGWMMLFLGVLTISLAWHGRTVLANKRAHADNRKGFHVGVQIAVVLAALNCAAQGLIIGQPLMLGIAFVGVASGATNLVFMFRRTPGRADYVKEHVKALVGAGISVYSAFMTFGLARLLPDHAFNPMFWAVPLVVGVTLIIVHHRRIDRTERARTRFSDSARLTAAEIAP